MTHITGQENGTRGKKKVKLCQYAIYKVENFQLYVIETF